MNKCIKKEMLSWVIYITAILLLKKNLERMKNWRGRYKNYSFLRNKHKETLCRCVISIPFFSSQSLCSETEGRGYLYMYPFIHQSIYVSVWFLLFVWTSLHLSVLILLLDFDARVPFLAVITNHIVTILITCVSLLVCLIFCMLNIVWHSVTTWVSGCLISCFSAWRSVWNHFCQKVCLMACLSLVFDGMSVGRSVRLSLAL